MLKREKEERTNTQFRRERNFICTCKLQVVFWYSRNLFGRPKSLAPVGVK